MSKFKINDVIHYMDSNTPKASKVIGISTVKGKVHTIYAKDEAKEGEELVYYHDDSYSRIPEGKAFATKLALQKDVFKEEKKANND